MGGKTKEIKGLTDLMREKGKLMLVTGSPITTKQVLKIFQRTPAQHVHSRPGKGGGTWEYVTSTYVKKVLNYVFGWLWSFEIMSEREIGGQVVVRGRLTILNPKDKTTLIVKEQYGRADIKVTRNTNKALDIGNDYKAAASDALKKCAAELGIASDIYGREEFREIGIDITNEMGVPKVKGEDVGIQPEIDQIRKVLKEFKWKGEDEKAFMFIKKLTGIALTDWRMTASQSKLILSKLLAKKHSK